MPEKLRKNLIEKKKELMTKFNSFRENFKKKEKDMRTDLEETTGIWRKMNEKFKWWQSLP